jgi:hypothetical protein
MRVTAALLSNVNVADGCIEIMDLQENFFGEWHDDNF